MRRASIVALLLVLIAAAVEAQAVNPPQRVTRPPRAQGTTRSLQLDTSLFGGYDHNLGSSDVPAIDATSDPSTFRGWGSAGVKFSIAGVRRSLDVGAGATANTVRNRAGSASSGPVYGTNANAGFQTQLGGATTFALSNTATRTPYYSMGLFSALPQGSYSPDANPVNGIIDGHLWFLNSSATVSRSMSRRLTTSVSYSYQRNLYEGGSTDLDAEQHSAVVSMGQQISRTIQLQGSYHVASRGAAQGGVQYDGLAHGFSLGFSKSQQLGPSRALRISVGGGAELIDAGSTRRYWQPTYNASLGTDIGRSWVVSANYTQTSTMLASPLSAPDSYLTQTAVISVGGSLLDNLDLTLNTGAARGEIAAINSVTGSTGRYTALNSSLQVRVQVLSGLSAVVSTNYYRSELNGAAKQFLLSSGDFERASTRVGFTWNVPLLGPAQSGRRPRGR
jgi:hypothetical protein